MIESPKWILVYSFYKILWYLICLSRKVLNDQTYKAPTLKCKKVCILSTKKWQRHKEEKCNFTIVNNGLNVVVSMSCNLGVVTIFPYWLDLKIEHVCFLKRFSRRHLLERYEYFLVCSNSKLILFHQGCLKIWMQHS